MLVAPSGIVILVRLVQLRKVFASILVTPSGIVTLVRSLQLWKALFPILVTGFPSIFAAIISSPNQERGESAPAPFERTEPNQLSLNPVSRTPNRELLFPKRMRPEIGKRGFGKLI